MGVSRAEFSKDEVDYLSEAIYSEIDDKQARHILQRAYVGSSGSR